MESVALSALFVLLVFAIPVAVAAGVLILLVGCSVAGGQAVQEFSTPKQRVGIPGFLLYEPHRTSAAGVSARLSST
ncbi:MAG: hypothetical protein KIT09_21465 [Bryobacteraceae bacterium]|nr:hypothetical protein [Bryobacteraceae bacterium]